jgi:phage terminase large subunit
MFKTSELYLDTLNSTADILVHQGGTSSGKTYSILQALFSIAISEPAVITVVGQDIPNLKVGALRDALEIYDNSEELKALVKSYNKTDRIFEFNSGAIMEFKSYANAQDAKSGKRDYCFINEANGITYEVYTELALRTRKRVFLDYNPNTSFWVHEKVIGQPNVQLIISDHRHNPFLSDKVREKIEALKLHDVDLWKVYGRGMTGKIEGLIFRNWTYCDKLPDDGKLVGYGLDFGFTNDPTAVVKVKKYDGELWIDLVLYENRLTNPDIYERLKDEIGRVEVIADSAEPKSIQELNNLGLNVYGALKGADSIKNSIDILKRYKMNVTRSSSYLIKELNSYKYKMDKVTGNAINEPVDFMNHAIDALRYLALNKLAEDNSGVYNISFA